MDQRIRDALARAAAERKSTAAAVSAKDNDKVSHISDAAPDVNTVMMHEDDALLHLHSQAVAIHNIGLLVPVVLDLAANNYSCWHE